jgi:hypothetical protein
VKISLYDSDHCTIPCRILGESDKFINGNIQNPFKNELFLVLRIRKWAGTLL